MRSDNTYLKLILALCLLGILVSGWLLSIHIRFTTGMASLTEACTIVPGIGGAGCANIAVSEYSDIFGIPLAAIAMSFYFSLLILVFWAMRNFQMAYEALYVGYFLSTLSILVTVVMFSISRFVVQSFCMGCAILWIVNLAIWPAFVMHLKLRWSDAVFANLELIRPKILNLKKERIIGSFMVGLVCLLAFSVIGLAAKKLQVPQSRYDEANLLTEFKSAPQVFLPEAAYGGPQSKGGTGASAPILDIVEFADYQCPGCRMAAQFLRPFLLKHGDKARVTFRNFPLDGSCNPFVPNGGHNMACAAAKGSICAGKQGKFWEFHDQIFDNQEDLNSALISSIAKNVGLDVAAYEACLGDPATETQLQQEMQWGDQIGLQSTPTIVINGKKLAGAKTPADLEGLLKALESERK